MLRDDDRLRASQLVMGKPSFEITPSIYKHITETRHIPSICCCGRHRRVCWVFVSLPTNIDGRCLEIFSPNVIPPELGAPDHYRQTLGKAHHYHLIPRIRHTLK